MSLFNIFNVAGSAMSAQGQRLNVVSSNIANADSTTSADGSTYRAKQVVFSAVPVGAPGAPANAPGASTGVKVQQVVEVNSPLKKVFDPKHPAADEEGYVSMPNVNVVEEMVNMISASRSYQTNAETMNTAKNMLQKTLMLGQ